MKADTALPATADYVVVGTGSAGAVLAARLSESPGSQVVALEAGPEDTNRFAHIPAAFSKLFGGECDWGYLTTAQPELGNRQILYPRGKLLGGSSSMNAMMWVRGFAADYDEWATAAGDTWSFAHIVEYFKKIEAVEGASEPDEGRSGPLQVSHQRTANPWTGKFLAAAELAGFKNERANTAPPEGFCQTMVNQKRGARWSTADAYLKPARRRPNLTVLTEAHANRVIFEGTRAVGVEYRKGHRVFTVRPGRRSCSAAARSTLHNC